MAACAFIVATIALAFALHHEYEMHFNLKAWNELLLLLVEHGWLTEED